MVPIYPGRILRRELKARQLSANALARALRVPSGRIVDILNGKRSITAETALRLGRYFGNAPQFWINLQAQYDLAVAMRDVGRLVEREVQTGACAGGSPSLRSPPRSIRWVVVRLTGQRLSRSSAKIAGRRRLADWSTWRAAAS